MHFCCILFVELFSRPEIVDIFCLFVWKMSEVSGSVDYQSAVELFYASDICFFCMTIPDTFHVSLNFVKKKKKKHFFIIYLSV